jgi:hypothetical protein
MQQFLHLPANNFMKRKGLKFYVADAKDCVTFVEEIRRNLANLNIISYFALLFLY